MKTIVFCSILLIASVAAAEELAIGAAAPSFSLVNATSNLSIWMKGLMSSIESAAESSFLRPTSFVP